MSEYEYPCISQMKQIMVRDMEEQDIGAVVRIEEMSFSTPWSETSFFTEVYKRQSIAKVALSGEDIVGHICAAYVLDEGHILDLAVRPDYRGMGIASMLVKNVIEELKAMDCRFLYLEARASNDAARRLYQGFGFRVNGTRKRYYVSPAEDAVLMMLDITA